MILFQKLRQNQTLVTTRPEMSVHDSVRLMTEKSVGSVLIMVGEKLLGIFTERDLLNRVVSKGLDPKTTPLSQVMSKKVVTVDINDTLEACYDKMQQMRTRHVPIVEGEKVVGMVTMRNILEWLWKEIEEENNQLKRYIQGG